MWIIVLFMIILIINEGFNFWNAYSAMWSDTPLRQKLRWFWIYYGNDFLVLGIIGLIFFGIVIYTNFTK